MELDKLKKIASERDDDPFNCDKKWIGFTTAMTGHVDAMLDTIKLLKDEEELLNDAVRVLEETDCSGPCDRYGVCRKCSALSGLIFFRSRVYENVEKLESIQLDTEIS